ncbi:MAG: hypothetical protein R2778_03085 [Saprospiraceae bacterium]
MAAPWSIPDTMFKTQGLVFNNPRWERQTITIGSAIKIVIDDVHLKLQLFLPEMGAPAATSVIAAPVKKTFIGGLTFEFIFLNIHINACNTILKSALLLHCF